MIVRCWAVYVFLYLIDKVSLQDPVTVSGFAGQSVFLPCLSKEKVLKPESMTAFWRFKTSMVVLNIENGNPSTENQIEMFKGRVHSFTSEYSKGNFTIRIDNLKIADQGEFSCALPNEGKRYKLNLQVKEPASDPKGNENNSSVKAKPKGIITFLMSVAVYLSFARL